MIFAEFASWIARPVFQPRSRAHLQSDRWPDGQVFVFGAGNPGVKIVFDLFTAGREALLSGRDTGSMSRTLLGRDFRGWPWRTLVCFSNGSR